MLWVGLGGAIRCGQGEGRQSQAGGPRDGISDILECEEVLTGNQEGPGPSLAASHLALNLGLILRSFGALIGTHHATSHPITGTGIRPFRILGSSDLYKKKIIKIFSIIIDIYYYISFSYTPIIRHNFISY